MWGQQGQGKAGQAFPRFAGMVGGWPWGGANGKNGKGAGNEAVGHFGFGFFGGRGQGHSAGPGHCFSKGGGLGGKGGLVVLGVRNQQLREKK